MLSDGDGGANGDGDGDGEKDEGGEDDGGAVSEAALEHAQRKTVKRIPNKRRIKTPPRSLYHMKSAGFTTLTGPREDKAAYRAMDHANNDEIEAWKNAKLLAAFMYAILGDKTKNELEAEGMTYERAASILSVLVNKDGSLLTNPFPRGKERYFDSWKGGSAPSNTEDDPHGGNYFYHYRDKGKK